jgi:30S ribosomal protein S31
MGKGDQKTRRGKLFSGSYGVLRPRKRKQSFSMVSSTRRTAGTLKKPPAASAKPAEKGPEAPPPIAKAVEEAVAEKPAEKPAEKKPAPKKTSTKKAAPKEKPEVEEEKKE